MSEEEKELVNNCKLWVTEEDINYTRWFGLNELSVLVNLIEKLCRKIDKVEYYIQQEIWSCEHGIWLCEHDIENCTGNVEDVRKIFVDRKERYEKVQNKLLGE